ncbi:MAG: DUF1573 domain-containing protein [Bacteroidota bacterium]
MKKLFSLLFFLVGLSLVATAQTESTAETKEEVKEAPAKPAADQAIGPKLEFESEQINFGTIEQNSEPFRTIKIKNVGDAPLLITNARGSCGCTVPTVPKQPIAPGASAEMKVRYDTKRLGKINKTVTLTTNEKVKTRTIRVVGQINAKPEGTPTKESNPFNNSKS